MRNIVTIGILAILFSFASLGVQAQDQASANTFNHQHSISNSGNHLDVGLRAGTTSGLALRHFSGNHAIKGIIGFWPNALSVTGMFEKHVSTGINNLNWYFGPGAHVSAFTGRYYYFDDGRYRRYDRGDVGIGVDGTVGLDYKIPPIPVAISLDVKPFIEVNTRGGAWFAIDPGLSIYFKF